MILHSDSTASKVFSHWKGPATVIEVKSPYSYIVEYNGGRQHVHANKLRKSNVRVDEVLCKSLLLSDDLMQPEGLTVDTCAVVYDRDTDFGQLEAVELPSELPSNQAELLPSSRLDEDKLAHLSSQQQDELLQLLDQFPECFSETPGCCNLVEHEIPVTDDFKPKRLRAYKVPEKLKPDVD